MPDSRMDGVVAQLVERLVRNEKVRGSIPLGSTIISLVAQKPYEDAVKEWAEIKLEAGKGKRHVNSGLGILGRLGYAVLDWERCKE